MINETKRLFRVLARAVSRWQIGSWNFHLVMFYLSLRIIPEIRIAFAEYPNYNNIATKKFAGNVNKIVRFYQSAALTKSDCVCTYMFAQKIEQNGGYNLPVCLVSPEKVAKIGMFMGSLATRAPRLTIRSYRYLCTRQLDNELHPLLFVWVFSMWFNDAAGEMLQLNWHFVLDLIPHGAFSNKQDPSGSVMPHSHKCRTEQQRFVCDHCEFVIQSKSNLIHSTITTTKPIRSLPFNRKNNRYISLCSNDNNINVCVQHWSYALALALVTFAAIHLRLVCRSKRKSHTVP